MKAVEVIAGMCRGTARTSALLLDDAKSAGDDVVVGKHERGEDAGDVGQTVHCTRSVVYIAVIFNDTDEDVAKIWRKQLGVGFGVFSHHETRYGTNGFIAAEVAVVRVKSSADTSALTGKPKQVARGP
jgi:hypothetical protein